MRHTEEDKLLIIVNFDSTKQSVNIKIPKDALNRMGVKSTLSFQALFNDRGKYRLERTDVAGQSDFQELKINLQGYGFEIYRIL